MPVEQQHEAVIVGTMSGERYLKQRYARPWHELYDGALPLVVGHYNIGGGRTPYVRPDSMVFGLDTSCCYGGALSALLQPEFRIVSMASRGNDWSAVKRSSQIEAARR